VSLITVTQQAHAKLNLLLSVTPELVGGKHLLTTVFTTISLADTLTFTFDDASGRAITLEVSSVPGVASLKIPDRQNIVYAAVETMERLCGCSLQGHLHIAIRKRIPHEGGLAGGSTDAAATLRVIAELWGMPPHDPVLEAAARDLGADVAFFLHGGCALMGGSGEKLLRRLPQPALDLVLVKPAEGVSTSEAYRAFDACPQPAPPAERLVHLLEEPDARPERIATALANNLYPAARVLMPALEALVAEVGERPGIHAALLTGSGSVVFGVCADANAASAAARHFEERGYWALPCTTI
jgi:4-diphosphocytidyl-2-C-methyl-D-erythritol kinase